MCLLYNQLTLGSQGVGRWKKGKKEQNEDLTKYNTTLRTCFGKQVFGLDGSNCKIVLTYQFVIVDLEQIYLCGRLDFINSAVTHLKVKSSKLNLQSIALKVV